MTYRMMLLILEPDDECVGGADGGANGPDDIILSNSNMNVTTKQKQD